VNDRNFEHEVLQSKEPVLVDFWAGWCVPCRLMTPVVEGLEAELKGSLKVGKTNVDDNPELATRLSVLNIPTLILFKDGVEVTRIIGVNSKESIMAKIRGAVGG